MGCHQRCGVAFLLAQEDCEGCGHRQVLTADPYGRAGQAVAHLGHRARPVHGHAGGAPGHCAPGAVDEEQRPLDLEWYVVIVCSVESGRGVRT